MEQDVQTIETEIVEQASDKPKATVQGAQAVMATPGQLKRQMERDQELRKVITEYIKNNMVSGKDYGSIDIKGTKSKPSLMKPGAEKFCSLFKVRPTFRKDVDTCNMLGDTPGLIAYICELVGTNGIVIGEGRGSYKVALSDTDFNINKAIKIAEKRAQVDAVLRTGCLSDFFTQDVEDAPADFGNNTSASFSSSDENGQRPPMTGEPTAAQLGLIDRLSRQKGVEHVLPKDKQEASDKIAELMALPNAQAEAAAEDTY